ncbi:MAG: glucosylceramidase [Candidatus Hydrogenedentota bacterium]
MHAIRKARLVFLVITIFSPSALCQSVDWWVSTENAEYQLRPMPPLVLGERPARRKSLLINVDDSQVYQSILGLGASFDHATCYNISQLPPDAQKRILTKIVHPEMGIGMNLMRLCMGTPDFTPEPWYSYCDVDAGESDPELAHFSIEKDKAYILPVVKLALSINPDLRFFASPWSPPAWMKTNESMLAGKLKPEWYDAYASYFVKFIKAYASEGIPIYAVTPQNEPDYPNPEYPTCHWTGEEQRDFIRDHLGPTFRRAGVETKIWCWDHNWNLLSFPRTVLSDPQAAHFVDGTGFHHYEGKVNAQSMLYGEFPDKHVYFTEGSVFRIRGASRIVEILRNWSRSYNAWVIMLDENRKPNNGPHSASQTPIELLNDGTVRYNPDYYLYGQLMKFIPEGAVRIETGEVGNDFTHVAFKDGKGAIVLVVVNSIQKVRQIAVAHGSRYFSAEVPPKSVATFRWHADPATDTSS